MDEKIEQAICEASLERLYRYFDMAKAVRNTDSKRIATRILIEILIRESK